MAAMPGIERRLDRPSREHRIGRNDPLQLSLEPFDMAFERTGSAGELAPQERAEGGASPLGESHAFIDGGASGTGQFLNGFDALSQRLNRGWIEPLGHQREDACVDGIGLGQGACRFCKEARAQGIDHRHRKTCSPQAAMCGAMIFGGGFPSPRGPPAALPAPA